MSSTRAINKNEIQLAFDLVANRALSAHLPNAAHDETKLELQYLRNVLLHFLEADKKTGESDHPTPP